MWAVYVCTKLENVAGDARKHHVSFSNVVSSPEFWRKMFKIKRLLWILLCSIYLCLWIFESGDTCSVQCLECLLALLSHFSSSFLFHVPIHFFMRIFSQYDDECWRMLTIMSESFYLFHLHSFRLWTNKWRCEKSNMAYWCESHCRFIGLRIKY